MEHIRSHIATIVFGLLLTLFGHDAVMAVGPHPSAHSTYHESPSPATEVDCGLTTGAQPQSTIQLDVDDLAVDLPLSEVTRDIAGFLPHWVVAPDHPPDVKRALLQVYLN